MQASITSEKIVCLPEARTCSSAVLACFRLTQAEYSLMLACASGLKPSECTASQRRTLQELENRLYAKRIEYPRLLKGQSWVLTGTGQAFLDSIALLSQADIKAVPAKILPFRSIR